MELLWCFWEEYATAFLYLCLTGFCTLLCNHLRHVFKEKRRRKTILELASLCAREILARGEETDAALLQGEAEEALLEALQSRGIALSHMEARLLLRRESVKRR